MFLKACSASRGAGVELACSPIAERAESVLVRPATAITAIAEAQASIRADQGFIIDPSFMDCCLRTRGPFRAQSSIIWGRAARHVRSDTSNADRDRIRTVCRVRVGFRTRVWPLARYPWLADEQRRVGAVVRAISRCERRLSPSPIRAFFQTIAMLFTVVLTDKKHSPCGAPDVFTSVHSNASYTAIL